MPARKYFTPEQAQRSLVLVRRVVADIVQEYPRLLEAQEVLELSQRHGSVECLTRVQADMLASVKRLQRYADELSAMGVDLGDFARGRVEFPALSGGREVRLCWQYGEEQVSCWYDPGLGKASRRPIAELATA